MIIERPRLHAGVIQMVVKLADQKKRLPIQRKLEVPDWHLQFRRELSGALNRIPIMDLPSSLTIERRIYLIRGEKVMLDRDLADLYGVPTKEFNRAVSRQAKRFPAHFRFQLTRTELKRWRAQRVLTEPQAKMGLRRPPWAFTEHGVAMLSGVLDNDRAISVHIAIISAFIKMGKLLASHADLARKLDALERKYDARFKVVFDELRAMREFQPEEMPVLERRTIGFTRDD